MTTEANKRTAAELFERFTASDIEGVLIGFRDGKIASVHEYLDTHHAFDVWMRP